MRHHLISSVFLVLWGLSVEASAQGGTRALPGAKKYLVARNVPDIMAAGPVGPLPLLPRYWHLADSAERADATEVFNQYLRHFIKYPTVALKAGVGGIIYALLTVQPNGSVSSITINRRDLSVSAPPAKAVQALDAELQRVAWQLQFRPAIARIDSSATTSAIAEVTELDVTTESREDTETDDSIDITNAPEISRTLADTVTISYRFVPR